MRSRTDDAPFKLKDHLIKLMPKFMKGWEEWHRRRPELFMNLRPEKIAADLKQYGQWVPPEELTFPIHSGREAFRMAHFEDTLFICRLEGVTTTNPMGWVAMLAVLETKHQSKAKLEFAGRTPLYQDPPDHLTKLERSNYLIRKTEECLRWMQFFDHHNSDWTAVAAALDGYKRLREADQDADQSVIAGELLELRAEVDRIKDVLRENGMAVRRPIVQDDPDERAKADAYAES